MREFKYLYSMIPNRLKEIASLLISNGYECYLGEASTLNLLLDGKLSSFSLLTNAPIKEIDLLLPFNNIGHTSLNPYFMDKKSNRICSYLIEDSSNVEILTIQSFYKESSKDKDYTIKRYLSKNISTINTIVFDMDKQVLVDPFNGYEDLINKQMVLTKKSFKRLKENPSKIIEVLDHFCIYCMERFDEESLSKMHKARKYIKKDSKNINMRDISYMMYSIFSTNNIVSLNYILTEFPDIFAKFIPEIGHAVGFNLNNSNHIFDLWGHTVRVITRLEGDIIVRLAALFHDLGKPDVCNIDDKGVAHYKNHSRRSSSIFMERSKGLFRLSHREIKEIDTLIKNHGSIPDNRKGIKSFCTDFGNEAFDRLLSLKTVDILAQHPIIREQKLEEVDKISDIFNSLK